MKVLFIHQNFPGQFKYLAPALVAHGHDVTGMTMLDIKQEQWEGVRLVHYKGARNSSTSIHPWLIDFEAKTIRGEACFRAALLMRGEGYTPDVIIAHHGWGESLFLKEVWPEVKLGIYCEFFYRHSEADVGFDPEFPEPDPGEACRLRLKNINNFLHFDLADGAISPTQWQASTFPKPFREKITVVHDGIDCATLQPNPDAHLTLNDKIYLDTKCEIITFVNRNLEPYRGYHIFMRALPEIMKRRPNARVLIIGGDDVSYGAKPQEGKSWKEIFLSEVRHKMPEQDLKRIHFLGVIPYHHFISVLQLSTVHVYLTYPFVLSWSLLEAMSIGCAIIASDTQPLKEAIVHNETGKLVDFFDVYGLAEEVSNLLDNEAERKRLGENARNFAKSNYDLRSVCLPRQIEWVENLGD